jgi:prepilin-type N-terminal cleavage/methylation domain-containing protein
MRNNAYTLIEVLVAVTIFSFIIAGPTGLFITSLRGQRKALATMEIVDNSSYALEYISRALRMAKKDTTGDCITAGSNYENPDSDVSKIRFLNYQGLCQEFSLNSGQLGQQQSTDETVVSLGGFLPLTPDDLKISTSSLKFQLSGKTQGDNLQPRVTISFEIQKKNQPETKIRLQTTISQRNLDIQQY